MVTAFASYSHDSNNHKVWVRDLAARLRGDGVTVALDQWEVVPGDQLPEFMERSIRDSKYVLVVCTPGYKRRADERKGGVGYEGDIITGDLLIHRNQRKFIPILRSGEWAAVAPSWLKGKYFVDLRGDPYSEDQYNDLLTTLLGTRPQAPPVGVRPTSTANPQSATAAREVTREPITIEGIIADKVTMPLMDGTRGSGLYQVPFKLSRRPEPEWAELFIDAWNHSIIHNMHRPGTADVEGDIVWLLRTTLDEVEKYHRDSLKLCAQRANEQYAKLLQARRTEREAREGHERAHRAAAEDAAKRIKFD